MQDQISAAVLFLAKLIERSNTNCATFNADQLEMFKTKLAELLNDRFANHWFPEAPNRGQGYRCIRLNKNVKKDQILEHAAKASGMSYEDMRLPVELTLWVDPHEVCCRFGESKGSYCTLASFNDKENQEIFISDELFNRAANFHTNGGSYPYNNGGRRHQTGGQAYHRNRKTSEHSSGSSSDEKMNSPLKQRPIQSNNINSPNSRRQLTAANIKNQKSPNLNQSHHKSKMSLNNVSPPQNQQYHNQSMGQSWFNMAPPQQPWMPTSMSTSPPSSTSHGQYSSMRQMRMPPAINYYNQSTNYTNRTNYFNKPTVKV
uniref:Protein BTG4 n=1 Tax=Cacopsylla melanoneura TaxID=428564 RepID=A0A8D8PSW2_9HEMI